MLQHALIAAFLVAAPLACGFPMDVIRGSGRIVERDVEVAAFSEVDVGAAITVEIRQGAAAPVHISADDNVMDALVVEVVDGELKLGVKPNTAIANATVRVTVTTPDLDALDVGGAARATLVDFSGLDRLAMDIGGASEVEGRVACETLSLEVGGASQVELSGSAESLDLDASGASKAHLAGLPVADADVEASGASKVDVVAGVATFELSGSSRASTRSQTIDRAELSGASKLEHNADADLGHVDLDGASRLEPR